MRYLTKEWYIACQADPMTPEVQKQLDEIDRAYCAAQTRETLPDVLLQQFFFHDGVVREIITGTDLTLRIDSPYSEYHTVTFRGARLKQEPPRVGAVWLIPEQRLCFRPSLPESVRILSVPVLHGQCWHLVYPSC